MDDKRKPISIPIAEEINYRTPFYIFLTAVTVFRLFYIQWVELAPDEAYYWTWSRNLQWGYYDHPPLAGFLIFATTWIFGRGEFGVRVGWVFISAVTTFLLYRLGSSIFKSEKAGFLGALLINIILLVSTGAVIVTPDGPQGLFWVLGLFFVHRALQRGGGYWYLTGTALGLGLLSKYTMVLFIPCIFLFLLSSAEGRAWLRRKEPYLALAVGLAIFLPVILWNASHDWVSFRFQLSHGLEAKKAAGWRYFEDYWGGQAGVVSPLMFLALIWAMVRSAYNGFREDREERLLLFWTSAPILLFFAYTSLRSKVEANWPALAYFAAVTALAGLIAEGWNRWEKKKKGFFWAAAGVALLFTFSAHLQPLYPFIPIPAKKDPTAQLYGWRKLGGRIMDIAAKTPGREIFLLTPRHQLVAEAMFYTGLPVYQWDAPLRVNHLSRDHSPAAGSDAIFFNEETPELPRGLAEIFQSCEKMESLKIERQGLTVRTHPFWRCTGFKGVP